MTVRRMAGACVLALVAGCAGQGPTLPPISLLTSPFTSGSPESESGPLEASLTVTGTSTGVFTQVASAALGCWFGADGPLKASHVYRAEAEPPAKGGAAAIVIYERDTSTRDQRGLRAYQVSFTQEGAVVQVATKSIKMEPKLARAMASDVAGWVKGGNGCRLRALFPPPAPVATTTRKKVAGSKKL
jgi:hypothetical protein